VNLNRDQLFAALGKTFTEAGPLTTTRDRFIS